MVTSMKKIYMPKNNHHFKNSRCTSIETKIFQESENQQGLTISIYV